MTTKNELSGTYHECNLIRKEGNGYIAEAAGLEFFIHKREIPVNHPTGTAITLFLYINNSDELCGTTAVPKGGPGDFSCMTVIEANKHGAFLDWGIPKDLFVPYTYMHHRLSAGQKTVVKIIKDEETGKLIGVTKLKKFFNNNTRNLKTGESVHCMVYGFTNLGAVLIINNEYHGMIFKSDIHQNLNLGSTFTGHIKEKTKDGKLTVSAHQSGFSEVLLQRKTVLEKLKKAGGFLSFTDKSSPQEIKDMFGISKALFKKAIGSLYKDRTITISDSGITLNKK
jgi:predicted RNA-binding protein (virulence factor B family)